MPRRVNLQLYEHPDAQRFWLKLRDLAAFLEMEKGDAWGAYAMYFSREGEGFVTVLHPVGDEAVIALVGMHGELRKGGYLLGSADEFMGNIEGLFLPVESVLRFISSVQRI